MKKTFTNGEVFTLTQVLFEGNEALINRKNLMGRMAVRQALKFNQPVISDAYKTINEMIQDIVTELVEDFVAQEKATKDDNGYQVKKEFEDEFLIAQQGKLNELSNQTVKLDMQMIPESEYLAYAAQNDGKLTEGELDMLELFLEKKETKKEDE